jgi:hypothetical protein
MTANMISRSSVIALATPGGGPVPPPNQNIENNPMQSSRVVAGCFERALRKHFDTSGKSPAQWHHHAICRSPIALPNNGRFGAMAGRRIGEQRVARMRAR